MISGEDLFFYILFLVLWKQWKGLEMNAIFFSLKRVEMTENNTLLIYLICEVCEGSTI